MKKFFALALILVTMLSLVACSNNTYTEEEVTLVITDMYKSSHYATYTPVKGWKYDVKYTVYCEELDFEDDIKVFHSVGMAIPHEYYYSEGDILTGILRTEYDENGTVVSQEIIDTHK